MREDEKVIIPEKAKLVFYQKLSDINKNQRSTLCKIWIEISSTLNKKDKSKETHKLENKVKKIFFKRVNIYPKSDKVIITQSLLSKLALNLPYILSNLNLPKSILVLYPDVFERLAYKINTLEDIVDDIPYLGLALGLSIPCGVTVVHMNSKVNFHSVILSVIYFKKLYPFFRYFQANGHGKWLRIHLDYSKLCEFNEQGWDDSYMRISDLLKHPFRDNVCGMVGTSWFYDPKLLEISPNLSYLHQRPLERGAFLLRHHTTRSSIEFAIQKSKKRRSLYQEMKYFPNVYSVVWPRRELLSWTERKRLGK